MKTREEAIQALVAQLAPLTQEEQHFLDLVWQHDVTYNYSDDIDVWRKGAHEKDEICETAKKLIPARAQAIWNGRMDQAIRSGSQTEMQRWYDSLGLPVKKDLIPESPYGVVCEDHGPQGLSKDEYNRQMSRPDSLWRCPIRGCTADVYWDDDRYEAHFSQGEPNGTDAG